jgi:hypothetical protein
MTLLSWSASTARQKKGWLQHGTGSKINRSSEFMPTGRIQSKNLKTAPYIFYPCYASEKI